MKHIVTLARSKSTSDALDRWLDLLCWQDDDTSIERIIYKPFIARGGGEAGILSYETLLQRIERAVSDSDGIIPLNRVIILVDAVRLNDLNPIQVSETWEGLLAMLILSLPEVCWVFGVISDNKNTVETAHLKAWHSLPALLARPRRDPLFDPTGLRNWIRSQATASNQSVKEWLPKRSQLAAAIDEEPTYAYFHGYTAYRFGYRADAVTTWTLTESLFKSEKSAHVLLLEDMSLNFPDRPPDEKIIDLKVRDGKLPGLKSIAENQETCIGRFLITIGQSSPKYKELLGANKEYIRSLCKNRPRWGVLKPAGGMFDLWIALNLFKKTRRGAERGYAKNFVWPPKHNTFDSEKESLHGAPGRLLVIAESLLRRTKGILYGQGTILSDITGAVLATDALELLGGKTPTASSDALYLKHMLEVRAECHFGGVKYHLPMKQRIREVARDSAWISQAAQKRQRKSVELNNRASLSNGLVKLLRDENQFDEEQHWANEARNLHTSLWMRDHPARLLFAPFLRYINFIVASFSRFFLSLFLWVTGLTALFWACIHAKPASPDNIEKIPFSDGIQALSLAMQSFMGAEPLEGGLSVGMDYAVALRAVAIVIGLIHLGIFVAQLYTVVSRR